MPETTFDGQGHQRGDHDDDDSPPPRRHRKIIMRLLVPAGVTR